MSHVTIAVATYVGIAYLLWALFLAAMALRWRWSEMTPVVKALALPLAFVAFVIDIGFNVLSTIPFLDLPREATFSQRMGRYKSGSGVRATVARWICANVLDPFQVGGHCK